MTAAMIGGRRPAQLDDWLQADTLELDAQTLAEIDAALASTGAGTDEAPQPPPVALPPRRGDL